MVARSCNTFAHNMFSWELDRRKIDNPEIVGARELLRLGFVKFFAFLCALAIAACAYWYFHKAITYPPGVLIADEPSQIMLPKDTAAFSYGGFRLKPLAVFSIDARVLHRKKYRYDKEAALVPVDLALGWGPMSDQRGLNHLNITQSMRFYWYEYEKQPPIPVDQIVAHSTNVHIIPATKAVAARCNSLREGSLVHLSGDLVEASGPNIPAWSSSLSRTDTGNGACELMWVKELSIMNEKDLQDRQSTVVSR